MRTLPSAAAGIRLADAVRVYPGTLPAANTRRGYGAALDRLVCDFGADSEVALLDPDRVAGCSCSSACGFWRAQGRLATDPVARLRARPTPPDNSKPKFTTRAATATTDARQFPRRGKVLELGSQRDLQQTGTQNMTSASKLAIVLVAAALSVAALAGTAFGEQETAADRHEGVADCIQWWWTDSGTPTTTIHWKNLCPSRKNLMVSWRNNRPNAMNPDDVMYGIPGGHEGSDTWEGIPVSFRQV
ncbi:hypothetical protein AB0M34_08315 [Nocardia sp. NPDC050193]